MGVLRFIVFKEEAFLSFQNHRRQRTEKVKF